MRIQQRLFPIIGAVPLWFGWTLAALPGSHAQAETSWPEFHGPLRDNMSRETGLLKEWPADGPKLVWRFAGCGKGYAAVSIAQQLAFTSGDFGEEEFVLAVSLDGKPKWKAKNGKAWKGPQPGSRTTPTYSDGLVFQLNAYGSLTAFNATTGQGVWSVNLTERFDAPVRNWGFAENLAAEDNLLFCTPGGTRGRGGCLGQDDRRHDLDQHRNPGSRGIWLADHRHPPRQARFHQLYAGNRGRVGRSYRQTALVTSSRQHMRSECHGAFVPGWQRICHQRASRGRTPIQAGRGNRQTPGTLV